MEQVFVAREQQLAQLQSFLDSPDLIDIFVPRAGLATRAGAFLAGRVGWLERLEQLKERK